MTKQEQIKKIQDICDETIKKLEKLNKERKGIVSVYVKDLETKKIDEIRASMGL